jgi:hypothetical protein
MMRVHRPLAIGRPCRWPIAQFGSVIGVVRALGESDPRRPRCPGSTHPTSHEGTLDGRLAKVSSVH